MHKTATLFIAITAVPPLTFAADDSSGSDRMDSAIRENDRGLEYFACLPWNAGCPAP
jgi:hypothetical protein